LKRAIPSAKRVLGDFPGDLNEISDGACRKKGGGMVIYSSALKGIGAKIHQCGDAVAPRKLEIKRLGRPTFW